MNVHREKDWLDERLNRIKRAVGMVTAKRGRRRVRHPDDPDAPYIDPTYITIDGACRANDVTRNEVQRMTAVMRHGTELLKEAVDLHIISLGDAAYIAKAKPELQEQLVQDILCNDLDSIRRSIIEKRELKPPATSQVEGGNDPRGSEVQTRTEC